MVDFAGPPDRPGEEPVAPFLVDDLPLEIGLRPTLDRLADRVANVVQSAPLTSPILVSGDWGAGKTTLLRGVCRKLADAAINGRGTPTTMFEAWQYESANALLPALMRRVWDCTPESYRAKKAAKALLWELLRWAASMAARVTRPLLGSGLELPAGLADELDVEKAAKRANKVLGDLKPPSDPVDALRDAFAKLVANAWPDSVPVIFIDDLDRCNPMDAVTLMDAIRALASSADRLRVRFVVAIDRSVITQAISAKFANIRGYDGNRYLEKIFPIEFQVPSPPTTEIKAIIEALAQPLAPTERELAIFALSDALRPAYFANARLIKRCFNRHRLLRYFEMHGPPKAEADRLCVQWIAAIERWPRLRTLQQRRQPDFWSSVAVKQPTEDPDLKALLVEPGFSQWLALHRWPDVSNALDQYDEADARLRQFGM